MSEKVSGANLGFEREIFAAADKLRGNVDAAEYKNVVLGLIFLKYISDSFEEKYRELLDEGDGFEEDRDEYMAENIFFVPKEARWEYVASKAMTADWMMRESGRANMRRKVKRLLAKYNYPKDLRNNVIDLIVEQAEYYDGLMEA